jgi:hypothetical protein
MVAVMVPARSPCNRFIPDRIPIHLVVVGPKTTGWVFESAWVGSGERYRVTVLDRPGDALTLARRCAADPPRAVIVELDGPSPPRDSLDVLRSFGRTCPETALVVRTTGRPCDLGRLRAVWAAVQPLSVLGACRPERQQVAAVERLLACGRAHVDPALQPRLPTCR